MLKRTLLFAALHVLMVVGLVAVILVTGGDDSVAEPEGVERIATSLLEILGQPGIWAHKTFNTPGSDLVEWGLVGATSLVWGVLFASMTRPRAPRSSDQQRAA